MIVNANKNFTVYCVRNGKLVERFYDTLDKAVKYVHRYISNIKDYIVHSHFTPYEDLIIIELVDGSTVKIYTPLDKSNDIDVILYWITFDRIFNK